MLKGLGSLGVLKRLCGSSTLDQGSTSMLEHPSGSGAISSNFEKVRIDQERKSKTEIVSSRVNRAKRENQRSGQDCVWWGWE